MTDHEQALRAAANSTGMVVCVFLVSPLSAADALQKYQTA
jgi:hypothetical protein